MAYAAGDTVQWNWGDGTASGTVKHVYTEKIEKTLKGTEVIRDADKENPAYLIEQEDGDQVLKSHSELKAA